jgi:phenylalanyl-tRNA synthetase alpha chain
MDKDSVSRILGDIKSFTPSAGAELEQFRINYLGKKGIVTNLLQKLKNAAPEQRKEFGRLLNELKSSAENVPRPVYSISTSSMINRLLMI